MFFNIPFRNNLITITVIAIIEDTMSGVLKNKHRLLTNFHFKQKRVILT